MSAPRPARLLGYAAALAVLAFATSAHALLILDVDVGLKGGVHGALLLSEPDFDYPAAEQHFGGDDAFGVGGSGGLYGELRLFDAVGLELDLLLSLDRTQRTEDYGGGVELEHEIRALNLRVPLLLKGYLSFGPVGLSLGVGPEWVRTIDHSYELSLVDESLVSTSTVAEVDAARETLRSAPGDALFLTGQLEVAIDLVFLRIPIDLRVGRNLSQTDRFEDRYAYEVQGSTIYPYEAEVQAIHSWDFRLMTGVAMSF